MKSAQKTGSESDRKAALDLAKETKAAPEKIKLKADSRLAKAIKANAKTDQRLAPSADHEHP